MTEDTPPPPPAPGAPAPRRSWPRRAAIAALSVAAAAGALLAGAGAAWRSEAGTRWLLAHVPGLQATHVRGSLGGGDLRIGALRADVPGLVVDITALHATGLRLAWRPAPHTWLGVSLDGLEADSTSIALKPADPDKPAGRAGAPASLRSPVSVSVARLRLGSLAFGGAAPLRDVRAAIALGEQDGARHRVDQLSFAWERVRAQGHATAGTDAPLTVTAAIDAHDEAGPPGSAAQPHWQAHASATGALAGLDVTARLLGDARPGHTAPRADLRARVTPFEALPAGEIFAELAELDLSALSARAPATRLQGRLHLSTGKPAALDADLANLAPAAWSAGGLPVSTVTARLEAPWSGESIAVPAIRVAFADAQGAGGELRAQGTWKAAHAEASLEFDQLQPQRLDARLGAWRVSGPLRVVADGLPPPASMGGATPTAPAAASAPWSARLSGRLAGNAPPASGGPDTVTPPPMTLQLDARVDPSAVALKTLELRAGEATLSAQAEARRGKAGHWQGQAKAQWKQLDPGAWLRLAESGPLRDGPNRLQGSLALHLADAPASWQGLAAIRGRAELTLEPSLLAGLPLAGQASLDAAALPWTFDAELHNDTNLARLDGRLRPGDTAADALAVVERLHLAVDAPALATLAPLAGGAATATNADNGPASGSARMDLVLGGGGLALGGGGRHAAPALTLATTGEVRDWNGLGTSLARLRWDVQAGADPHAPLQGSLALRDARRGAARIAHLEVAASGSLAEHRLTLRGDAPVSPPEWLAHLADLGHANGSRMDLQVDGRWRPAAEAPSWQGRVSRLELRATQVDTGSRAGALAADEASARLAPWLHVDPFDLGLSRNARGGLQSLRVGASQAWMAGIALSWKPAAWTAPDTPGGHAHWSVDAALAPFSVAQTLARAQPDLGWHGDLQVEARLHAAFDGAWHVDGRIARTGGDLGVSEAAGDPAASRRALGLASAVATVKADGARWKASAQFSGTRLGDLDGTWTAEGPSPGELPGPGSPLGGHVTAHVADMNVWGAWLPPGWRLGGELRTDLSLSGRWDAPRLTGEVLAQRLVVRNALEGVHAHDGDVAIRLAGDRAEIERFRLVGGNGELTVAGNASLGAAPSARLSLQARQFQLLGRIDRRIVASGTLGLQLAADALKVDGKLGIDEGLIDLSKGGAPTLDNDVEVMGSASSDEADAKAKADADAKAGRTTSLALAVDLGDKLRIRGRGIDALLRGALDIGAPNGQLAVRGTVRTRDGTYKAYGQDLQVTRGEITFTGPVGDPRLDILASRPNLDVTVGVAVTGTALAPHVRLYSEPEMADVDKLSWLMLGRAPEGLGSNDTALLQQAAVALLAGENEGPTDQLIRRLGLTSLSFRQQADANDVRQTVVSLGRQLSKRWYVGYERGVNATTGSWQLIYRIAQRLTVRAQSGQDVSSNTNGNSLDAIYTWRWN